VHRRFRQGLANGGQALYGAAQRFLGTFGVNSTSGSGKLALIGVVLLAFALSGCGRKSGLDAPPQASVQSAPAGTLPAPPRNNPLGLFEPEEEERPVAAQGQKRRIILDSILD
jgi:hypothetical protein